MRGARVPRRPKNVDPWRGRGYQRLLNFSEHFDSNIVIVSVRRNLIMVRPEIEVMSRRPLVAARGHFVDRPFWSRANERELNVEFFMHGSWGRAAPRRDGASGVPDGGTAHEQRIARNSLVWARPGAGCGVGLRLH